MATKVKFSTNLGDFTLQLNDEKAPKTVANFLEYINKKHYDGTIFHRVIPGFMVQGGGFDENMQQKQTLPPIENEANNGLKNKVGSIAMARTNDPHSATAQFFINTVNNDFLDFKMPSGSGWGYCVFGEVIEGMDVVLKIEKVETTSKSFYDDVPVENVVINKVEVIKEGVKDKAMHNHMFGNTDYQTISAKDFEKIIKDTD